MSEPRIERSERDGRTVWIKRYGDNGRRVRMALLRWIARRLGANALLAPVPLSGEAACASELGMLRRLAALGVRVPEVIESRPTELVLSDLGPILSEQLRDAPLPERERLLALGLAALRELHEKGGYVSQAVVRNLTHAEGRIGFIDLEEDPATMMGVSAAQARDLLLYVYSSARFFADAPERYAAVLDAALAAEAPAVRSELFRTVRALRWLAWLARRFRGRSRGLAQGLEALLRAADAA